MEQIIKNDYTDFSIHICLIAPNQCNQDLFTFQEISRKEGRIEGEPMVAPHNILLCRMREGRKVRAPQGRVVRNSDCPAIKAG